LSIEPIDVRLALGLTVGDPEVAGTFANGHFQIWQDEVERIFMQVNSSADVSVVSNPDSSAKVRQYAILNTRTVMLWERLTSALARNG
jgi:hypothetical protein